MASKACDSVKKAAKNGKNLVIVESPAKEKTIGKILGNDFIVKSSYGHVRDLPGKIIGVDVEHQFQPAYEVLPRAKKMLPELKRLAAAAGRVYLATDHDREGESIAWHLCEILKTGTDRMSRITFNEITPRAIKQSFENARGIDMDLVEAQQARRVVDRLVGYNLSPLLWKKIKTGLSAGRVQSVAVRLVVERCRETDSFKEEEYWSLAALMEKEGERPAFEARLVKWRGENVERTAVLKLFAEDYRVKTTILKTPEALAPITAALRKGPLSVISVESREVRQKPKPPFITSTLQQEAYNKLGFSSERTMRIAQSLYEGVNLGEGGTVGLITYMRTDSFAVSKDIREEAAKFIHSAYGAGFAPAGPPEYETKVKGAQEAHEAIHPTSVFRRPEDLKTDINAEQFKLYELIWKRFVASQMAEAVFQSSSVEVAAGNAKSPECVLRAGGRVLKFEGFLKIYQEQEGADAGAEEGEDAVLPALKESDVLKLLDVKPRSHKSSPPPSYNEASLIKTLEKHGIGRPSTYAPILKTIQERGYVRKQPKDHKLVATALGKLVTDKLKDFFPEIMELSYTAEVEEELDRIAEGKELWNKMVKTFYGPFAKDMEKAYKAMTPSKVEPEKSEEKCPLCSSPMFLRESRFGQYLSCSTFPKCKGKIGLDRNGQKIAPEKTEEKCALCGKPMVIRTGRRGRFMACSGYPDCKNTHSLDEKGNKIETPRPLVSDRKCEKCGKPLWLRSGRRGYFLACSGFPRCRNIKKVSEEEIEEIRQKAAVKQ